jgi:hypothetical protein
LYAIGTRINVETIGFQEADERDAELAREIHRQ